MIDRRKRKVSQVWKLNTYIMAPNGSTLVPGYYKIADLVDKEGTKDQGATLLLFKDQYGTLYDAPAQYEINRKFISTRNGEWEFSDEEAPEFDKRPFVVRCRVCGVSADVLMAYVQPTNFICPECSPVN